ncbi:MAG: helicase-related protein [Polyangiaceae bacterium]
MSTRDRQWLRAFLHLDARAGGGALVPERDVERQEDTVLRALDLLDEEPGVVLADEVGMGKTYEALGVVAARTHARADSRVLILTPGPDLNKKWTDELIAFGDRAQTMYAGFVGQFSIASTLGELIDALRGSRIVVAPVSVFAGGRAIEDQCFLLSLWAERRGLAGNQIGAIFKRYRDGAGARISLSDHAFLGVLPWDMVEPAVARALATHAAGEVSLDRIHAEGYEAFGKKADVDTALGDLRLRLLHELIPELDLLVVDEAHKLKNASSARATGVRMLFDRKFEKALFLTATPFQLDVEELSQVFSLFGLARGASSGFAARTEVLLDGVREYTRAYEAFERAWGQVDGVGAADFEAHFERDPELLDEPEDASLRALVHHGRRLLTLKRDRIEPGFRSWMIRSLREDKRQYRRSVKERLRPSGGPGVPFLLYERFIAELFRSKARTHKSAVQINMVSSFGAAREGALLADADRESLGPGVEAYRKLVQRVVGDLRDEHGGHPKIAHVVRDALVAAERHEKTLIFCARRQTLLELKREIEHEWNRRLLERWREPFPGAEMRDIFDEVEDGERSRGRHSKLQTRFQRGQDLLYLALRERYIPTLLDASEFAEENLAAVVDKANEVLLRQRLPESEARRIDWSIVKRCVEQATALLLEERGGASEVDPECLRRLTAPEFVPLGFDLEADDVESASEGTHQAEWRIDEDDTRPVIAKMHVWSLMRAQLVAVPAALRVRTVERLAGYLVSRFVPFLPELLGYAAAQGLDLETIESRALLPIVDRFWTTAKGRVWCDLLASFLRYAGRLDENRRKEVIDDAVRAGAIVRHTVDGESRERLREAFNTPLYPMILVANEVMQEGLDLHHHCRRVVHHDLAWNPAQLEQRVGRVDRLGSLVQRAREKKPETTLDVALPIIMNTIDERLERRVRMRERWLEFLLGAPPKFEEYGLADDPVQPLPLRFSEALRVELGPRAPGATR